MTMFTQNDKASEQDTDGKMPMRAFLETPVMAGVARFQAFAQQQSDDEAPRGPIAAVIGKALKMTGQLATSGDTTMTTFTRNESTENDTPSPREHSTMSAMFEVMRGHAAAPENSSFPAGDPPRTQAKERGVSLISKALKVTGQLESTEDIQIEGEVEGDVRGVSVTVGTNAKIKGTVYGDAVELAGTVEGKIEAKKVVLTSTAHMSGDVVHDDIRVESGAFLDGHCKPGLSKPESKPIRPAPKSVVAVKEPLTPQKPGDASTRI